MSEPFFTESWMQEHRDRLFEVSLENAETIRLLKEENERLEIEIEEWSDNHWECRDNETAASKRIAALTEENERLKPKCACGENSATEEGVVHRRNAPCFLYEDHSKRIAQLEEALKRIADVSSAFVGENRSSSYADFELRLIARKALESK
jgi:chromosome segregation ATPase